MRDFTAARREPRQIDHNSVGHARFDLTADEQAVAGIKIDRKAKSLELRLPLEALVFIPVHKPYLLHADPGSRIPAPAQFFSVAFTFIVGIEPSAREMMQPVLVFSTCCWNVA